MTDIREARDMLASIPVSSCSYQEWVDVGMALHNEGLPVSLWDEWSRNDSRYHAGECERKWRTFGNGSTKVTLGTVYHMAAEYGWKPAETSWGVRFDVPITLDDPPGYVMPAQTHIETPKVWDPCEQAITYLEALYEPDDHVAFVLDSRQDNDGKWKPATKGHCAYTQSEIISLIRNNRSLSVLGAYNTDAGAWICFNPVDGKGRGNANITKFRYALIESDTQSIEEQYRIYQEMQLPIRIMVHSGGKSLHAIVRIDAADAKEYAERVKILHAKCEERGLNVDTQNKNPARLSRFPGYERAGKHQYIVGQDIGCNTWAEWINLIDDGAKPYPVLNMRDAFAEPPKLKPVLIEGILRQGHKMILVSSSKAGKTFALIELAIAIAEGHRWFSFLCEQGPVLYLNMEIDEASFVDRVLNVYKALEIKNPHPEMIDTINLRGQTDNLNDLIQRVISTTLRRDYKAIIVDPIYKLGIGDENKAGEAAVFCTAMDKLANTGASVIYAHHHSKGAQGAKSSMDRASGSGVFARDPDAILDMIELSIPDQNKEEIERRYGKDVTAWRLSATLREFKRIDPVNLFFSWPLHEVDEDGLLTETTLAESERALKDGREKGAIQNKKRGEEHYQTYASIRSFNEDAGIKMTQSEYAEQCKVSDRQIRKYQDRYDAEKAELKAELSVIYK